MNAAAVTSPNHFLYFPGNYRWSAGMLGALSSAPYGGSDIAEVDRVGRRLRERMGDDEAWFQVWREEGDILRARAEAAQARAHPLTAASNYLRACLHYQMSDHFRQPKDDHAMAVYRESIVCFRKFAALTDRPRIEAVELPSRDGPFPAYFVHAENSTAPRNPCVVRFGGFDTQKELQYLRGTPDLVRRGISCLLVDGPGQGEAIRFRGMHLRHDFEIAGSAALDYLATRPDVDLGSRRHRRHEPGRLLCAALCRIGQALQGLRRVGRNVGLSPHMGAAHRGAETGGAGGSGRAPVMGVRRRDL